METSVEISMYPLKEVYKPEILAFIERLKSHSNIRVKSNRMSTQVFGEYKNVMQIITDEMGETMQNPDAVVFVLKLMNSNRE